MIKPVEGSGGYGIVFGPHASEKEIAAVRRKVQADPRSWIAQPVMQLSTVPTKIGDTWHRGTLTCARSLSTTAKRSGCYRADSPEWPWSRDRWWSTRAKVADPRTPGACLPNLVGSPGTGRRQGST